MPVYESTRGLGDPICRGEILKSKSITRIAETNTGGEITEHYRTRKGHRFVFLVLGIDTKDKPLDPTAALADMGFLPKKK